MGRQRNDRYGRWDVREQQHQFRSTSRERDQEKGIDLHDTPTQSALTIRPWLKVEQLETHRTNHSKITMQSFGRVQKRADNSQAVHRRLELFPNLTTLAHAADHQFPTGLYAADDLVHCAREILLREPVVLIKML